MISGHFAIFGILYDICIGPQKKNRPVNGSRIPAGERPLEGSPAEPRAPKGVHFLHSHNCNLYKNTLE